MSILDHKGVEIETKVTSKRGLKVGWTRATFIIKDEYLEKIRALSFWEKKDIKVIMDEMLKEYFKNKRDVPVKKEVL